MDDFASRSTTPSSAYSRSASTSDGRSHGASSASSAATSMSDLTQFLNRSSLSSRRISMESNLRPSSLGPTSDPRHHRPPQFNRRPSSSRSISSNHSSSSSTRSSAQLSRLDSLVTSLIDSDSEASEFPPSSTSPSEFSPATASYFTIQRHGQRQAGAGMVTIPDTEDMASRQQQHHHHGRQHFSSKRLGKHHDKWRARGAFCEHAEEEVTGSTGSGRRIERVMKPIKLRRRKEKQKCEG